MFERRRPAVPAFLAKQLAQPSGWLGRLVMGPILNRVNRDHHRLVLEMLELLPNDRVLEVGFGGGSLLQEICEQVHGGTPEGKAAGVEISEPMLVRARPLGERYPNLRLYRAAVEALPFHDRAFDKVCSVNTIYFWPDLGAGLREIARVVRPNGRIVLGFGSDVEMKRDGFSDRGFKLYSSEEVAEALRDAGFDPGGVERVSSGRDTMLALAASRIA